MMNIRTLLPCLALFGASFSTLHAQSAKRPQPGDLRAAGKIDFPISCASEAGAEFARGIALLHSFFYEEARRIFMAGAEQDPKCAMAQWGIAMTWWHPIWTPPTPSEMSAGTAAIDKAMAMEPGSDRERRYVAALHTYYHAPDSPVATAVGQSCHGPVGPRDRVVAYEKAMRKLSEKYPEDFEAQTFCALARLAVGYATPNDTGLSNQLAAAGILEALWSKNPNHPGVVHYLIHSYDYPAYAQRGLAAAKAYGSIAPWVPHALHMPSHIFTRLGVWDESVAANRASADASRAYAASRHRTATEAEELHALDYMVYSYLQEAQDKKAKEIVDFVGTVRQTNPELEFIGAYALAAIPVRFALERNAWTEAAALRIPEVPHWSAFPFMEALIEYAHALGQAHTSHLAEARQAVARMQELRNSTTDPKFDYFKKHLDLQMLAANAWIAYGEGKKEEAVASLRSAAESEDILGKHPVSPGALVPAREQLGSLLLELDRGKEAQKEFEAALKIYPSHYRGLYGAARAAEQDGEKESAHQYFSKLIAQTANADGSRPELVSLRTAQNGAEAK
ncbi:MAG: hypothetical protein H0T83_10390 [Chthoniobacterales bacterium]|nr:hypothetical protein [Chthoniobacterales bacterium]